MDGGTGGDNPSNPLDLTDVQKSRSVSFFFREFSEFDVSNALSQPAPPPAALAVRSARCTPAAAR